MKVFISWSGSRSRAVAEILRTWLPDVINYIEPWISSQDIEKGARWVADLVQQLSETQVGIVCLTPENLSEPWIHFEAGALGKALDRSRVCTYLFQLRPSDLEGPLVQFQATEAKEADTLRLLQTLNSGLGEHARSDEQLQRSFGKWWPELQKGLARIPKEPNSRPLRTDRELLEEMLDLLRSQTKNSAMPRSSRPWLREPNALFEGEDVELLAKSAMQQHEDENEDPIDWVIDVKNRQTGSSLGGLWAYRWNCTGVDVDDAWKYGSADLMTRGKFFVALCSDQGSPLSPYLLVAREVSSCRLAGRYFNLKEPRDSTPWSGWVVNGNRIDGKWLWGRWDFRRR
jgi:hypothetical protein